MPFAITPDGARVPYLADQSADGVRELFSVPIDASAAPRRQNSPLVAGGNVSSFVLDAASAQVLYLADRRALGSVELFQSFLAPTPKIRRTP